MKAVFDSVDGRNATLLCHHFDDVEAKEYGRKAEQSQPSDPTARDQLLLLFVDSFNRTAEVIGATRLNLDKDEAISVAADNVYLASAGGAEIAIENFHSLLAELVSSKSLAGRTQGLVPRCMILALAPAIQP